MGEEWVVKKPSRSDDVLDAQEQLRIADQVRAHFDSVLPKRPIKPNRSETESHPPAQQAASFDHIIPELDKYQSLRSQSQALWSKEVEQDEFVETHYYKELNSIDKQHHTTGSGFIRMMESGGGDDDDSYRLQLERQRHGGGATDMRFTSNPATNDWIPSMDGDQEVVFMSSKPNRSES